MFKSPTSTYSSLRILLGIRCLVGGAWKGLGREKGKVEVGESVGGVDDNLKNGTR